MRTPALTFRRWETSDGAAPAVIFQRVLGSGIYVLEFANGEEYVGQSIHPNSRFATHRRRFQDIVAVRFAEVPQERLNQVEQDLITERRRQGVHLRNRTLLAQPFGESPLDLIVTQEEQIAWLQAEPGAVDSDIAPERIDLALARRADGNSRLQAALRQHPHFDEAVDSIARYVHDVIPLPTETEGRGWVLSAWPSTNRTAEHRRFSTLSIQNVELLYLFEEKRNDATWAQTTVLNVADSLDVPTDLSEVVSRGAYRTTGPVRHIAFDGWHDIDDVLDYPEVRQAARELAMAQLRKGRAMFSRYHSEALADEVFARIG